MRLTRGQPWICERLLVVTHVPHYAQRDRLLAYAPYAIELAEWAALTRELVIAAPLKRSNPPNDSAVIDADNVSIVRQPETGGHTARAKLHQFALLPRSIVSLARAMRNVDAVHVRCPGNIGLLGALLAPIACPRRVAKYAGQWSAFPSEPWTVRLQRSILRSRWWGAPVLVYESARNTTKHVVPFFASVLTDAQMAGASEVARRRRGTTVSRILYVGRLTRQKNVATLVRAIAALRREGAELECVIVGDGPERAALVSEACALGVEDRMAFDGALSMDGVLARYEWADALALPSESEGWPKAVAEAMAFGLCCVGPKRGIVPWMLGEGRGVVVEPGSVDELVAAIRSLVTAGDNLAGMRAAASAWSQQFTVERFGKALREILRTHWSPVGST